MLDSNYQSWVRRGDFIDVEFSSTRESPPQPSQPIARLFSTMVTPRSWPNGEAIPDQRTGACKPQPCSTRGMRLYSQPHKPAPHDHAGPAAAVGNKAGTNDGKRRPEHNLNGGDGEHRKVI
jgi:hypothetical protein